MEKEKASVVLILGEQTELQRRLYKEVLELGFTPFLSKQDPKAALLVRGDKIDLVVVDLLQPKPDSVQLLKDMRKFCPTLPIFVMAPSDAGFLETAYRAGADVAFQMPLDDMALKKTIMRYLTAQDKGQARILPRHEIKLDIFWKMPHDMEFRKSSTLNVSAGGIFVVEEEALPRKKEIIQFNFEPGRSDADAILGKGLVRWVRTDKSDFCPAGYGLEFLALDQTSRQTLDQLLGALTALA